MAHTNKGKRKSRDTALRDVAAGLVFSMLVCCFAPWDNWGIALAEIGKCLATFAMLGVSLGLVSPLKRFLLSGAHTPQRKSSCTF